MNGMVTVAEIAKKWGISIRYVQQLCKQGRIEGAMKFGNTWAIPEDVERPEKLKSGLKVGL